MFHFQPVHRILGLNAVVTTDCERPWQLKLRAGIKWTEYVSPILILLAYWFSALSVASQDDEGGDAESPSLEDVSVTQECLQIAFFNHSAVVFNIFRIF